MTRISKAWKLAAKALGFALVFAACAGTASAVSPTPEIDPSSMANAVALVLGGAMLLTARRRRG